MSKHPDYYFIPPVFRFQYFSLVELRRIKNNLFIQQSNDLRNSAKEIGVFNENNRNFNGATKEVSRDFCNSQDNTDRGSMSDQAFACSASSVESLPSASGSSMFLKFAQCELSK